MGRCIYDSHGEFVYKYIFAEQASEQSRIVNDLRIGKLQSRSDDDIVTLTRKDIEKLNAKVQSKRSLLAKFYKEERKTFKGKPGFKTADMKDAKSLYTRMRAVDPDVLFWLMCHYFVKHGNRFFKSNAKARVLKLFGEY
jgi:hypothetical protein